METFFRKYFWVINLATLALAGYLVGTTVNDYLSGEVLFIPSDELRVPDVGSSSVEDKSPGLENMSEALKARSPFNSDPPVSEEKTDDEGEKEKSEEAEKKTSEDGMPESELDVQLIGTLVAPEPELSIATLKVEGEMKLARLGTELQQKATIVGIARRYLVVDEGGTQKYIRLWSDKKPAKKGRKRAKPARSSRGKKSAGGSSGPAKKTNWKEGVTKVSDTEYQISRSMLDEQLEDLSQLGMQARIVPNYRNGKYQGFKLVGVRPNSLYRAIGIRSGDIVKRINGTEINSPNKAIELFEQFKSSNNIGLDIERRGQVKSFNYKVK